MQGDGHDPEDDWRPACCGMILLGLVAAMESFTDWDMALQRLWFDSDTHEWLVSADLHRHLTWVFYKGPKALLYRPWRRPRRGGAGRAAARAFPRPAPKLPFAGVRPRVRSLAAWRGETLYGRLLPAAVGGVRRSYARQGVLECRNPANEGRSRGKCFPAGHASGGFALMMLFFAFPRRLRWFGLALGLAAGWWMGLYQMLRGQHFLSHTLFTMIGAWMIIVLIAVILPEAERPADGPVRRGAGPASPSG
ncbi:MAG: phosphatase PAP2 family protein [Bilophila sp.]